MSGEERKPLLEAGDAPPANAAAQRRPRVRPESEREELYLLSIQQNHPAQDPDAPSLAKTDAELRVFIEDRMMMQVKKDFSNVKIPEETLKELASQTVKFFQVELDLNIERYNLDEKPISLEFMADRLALLAFRYDRFLRSIKELEDREFEERARKKADEDAALEAIQRVLSRAPSDGSRVLPANLVEHMLQVGMEEHLKIVRNHLLGDDEPYGVTITFKDLTVTRKVPNVAPPTSLNDADKRMSHIQAVLRPRGPQTVWSATAKSIFGCCFALSDRFSSQGPRTKEIKLLKGLNGAILPGKVTLLLGAPKAGKTQLLHALSRQTRTKGPIKVTGDVYYNGHSYRKVFPSNFCSMVEQIDQHIPILTVRETLQFAYKCRLHSNVNSPLEITEDVQKLLNARVDLIMATLGLTRVANTIIGNEALKGISGGEMRRVTLGEMMVIGSKVMMLDEISTGLDSAATLDITKSIRSLCRVFQANALISLLQPPPETVELFDDIMLMSNGCIIYHGPRATIREWIESVGLTPNPTMDIADYLIDASLQHREHIFDAYLASEQFAEVKALLDKDPKELHICSRFPDNKRLIEIERALVYGKRYSSSVRHMFVTVIQRQWKVMIRNRAFIIARIVQNIVMGLLLGALYFDIPFTQFYLIAMILQQLLSMAAFSTMALIGQVVTSRNVFYKQNKQNFFPSTVYVAADYVVSLPFSLMDAFLLGSITYFMSGLSLTDNGRPYFVFLIIVISFGVCMASVIRLFGYAAANQNVAFATAVFFNVFGLIFSGAVATPNVIPPYFIWIYWAFSPFAWAYRSALQNEYYSSKYTEACESGCPNNLNGECVTYCITPPCPTPYPQMNCGQYFLEARQVATDKYFLWLGIGMLWIYTLLAVVIGALALAFLRWDDPSLSPVQADAVAEARVVREAEEAIKSQASPSAATSTPPAASPSTSSPINGDSKPETVDIEAQKVQTTLTSKGFVPMPLIWQNILYTIEVIQKTGPGRHDRHTESIDLLKNISGFAKPYTMTALMGSSGAGKTTLLDCLSYRKTVGRITGKVRLGSKQVIPDLFKKEVGYVEQFGVHNEKSTVRESVEFSARLRLGSEYTDKDRQTMVEETLSMLELRSIQNEIVGRLGETDALSFEENKRVTIAVELVANPTVLFADEPTSGLTSKEARLTMDALSRVAKSGRPVICTIHQPSAAIFYSFDRLLLLKRGGEVVFFGDLGHEACHLVRYFESMPGVAPLPEGLNPAAWMLDVIGAGVGRADKAAGHDFAEIYRSSDLYAKNEEELNGLIAAYKEQPLSDEPLLASGTRFGGDDTHLFEEDQPLSHADDTDEAEPKQAQAIKAKRYTRSIWVQFRALTNRNFVEYWRTPSYSLLRWIIMLIFSIVAGLTFLQQQMGNAAGVQSRVGIINMLLLLTANYNSATIVPFAFSRKALFYRERASGMYASFVYAITLQWVEDPYILVEVFLSVVVFYFLVGMANQASAFFFYVFLMYFFVSFSTYMGLMWSAAFGSQGAASLVSSLVIQLMVLFSGVALPGNTMPDWLLGFYYLTPVRWAVEGLLASQFGVYTQVICYTTGDLYTWKNGSQPAAECPIQDGNPVWFYLSDVDINACCSPLPGRPISARAYVFTGWTYPDGVHIDTWLGGTNGYHLDWKGYDFLYVIMAGVVVRSIAIILTEVVSHQKR